MMGELESKLKVRAEIARTEDASDRVYAFKATVYKSGNCG